MTTTPTKTNDSQADVSVASGSNPGCPRCDQSSGPAMAPSPAAVRAQRNQALDFTKGVLVLFMVLYHWINYFVSTEGYFYRYLRFITPSFIFITGFLITQVYLAKYDRGDLRVPKRLLQRGLKLLALFTLLNVGAGLVAGRNHHGPSLGLGSSAADLFHVYVSGGGQGAIFQVLVPISYLLVLCGGLLLARAWFHYSVYAVSAALFVGIFVLDLAGLLSGNLELIGIGFLAIFLGSVRTERIDGLAAHWGWILLAYLAYLVAVSIWGVVYPLQVAGVCLSLMLIYLAGTKSSGQGAVQNRILLLGRYSLLAYIVQIVVLQLLRRGMHPADLGSGMLVTSLFLATALTDITVEAVEFGRKQSTALDSLYRAVFA
ncbi:MAG: acyltransferase family protein [Verrucomicrobiia bacterium]